MSAAVIAAGLAAAFLGLLVGWDAVCPNAAATNKAARTSILGAVMTNPLCCKMVILSWEISNSERNQCSVTKSNSNHKLLNKGRTDTFWVQVKRTENAAMITSAWRGGQKQGRRNTEGCATTGPQYNPAIGSSEPLYKAESDQVNRSIVNYADYISRHFSHCLALLVRKHTGLMFIDSRS